MRKACKEALCFFSLLDFALLCAKKQANMSQEVAKDPQLFAKIIAHAKEYGFVFPSSELYDGLQAVYDYGQNGVELKNNLKMLWWKSMTQWHEDIVGIDSSIFMHPTIWKASGHVDSFNDPLIDHKGSKKRYRADVLIEDKANQLELQGQQAQADMLRKTLGQLLENEDLQGVRQLIIDQNIVCPVAQTADWTEVRQFNLMFSTEVGALAQGADKIYLRPETAQGIFVNYLNVQKTGRMKVPFGIAQIGKAFRNEIVARQFIFRMREFEQMEMQFFVRPGSEQTWYEHWIEARLSWHKALTSDAQDLRLKPHEKLAHYAKAACDIEFDFPFGYKEVEGIHSRGDFDLSQHQVFSKKKIKYHDPEINESYTPYVIETSIGADRLFLMTLCRAYQEVTTTDGEQSKTRIFLKFHPSIAPIKAAILPLIKKDGLPELAQEIYNDLKVDFKVMYEDQAAIGKRYTRQDLIGTPFCIVVDHESLEDKQVTVRMRDTTEQIRMPIAQLHDFINQQVSPSAFFRRLSSK